MSTYIKNETNSVEKHENTIKQKPMICADKGGIYTREYITKEKVCLVHGDCLDVMVNIETNSVDLILCDLPYGVTKNNWDVVIPFDKLWEQYDRIIKENGAVILFGSQPFTTMLISSNMKYFRYCLV